MNRRPSLLLQAITEHDSAVRFWHIGGKEQFMMLLQRFRGEFLLARPTKINGLDWLLVSKAQLPEIQDFCRRYGLHIEEMI